MGDSTSASAALGAMDKESSMNENDLMGGCAAGGEEDNKDNGEPQKKRGKGSKAVPKPKNVRGYMTFMSDKQLEIKSAMALIDSESRLNV